MAFVEFQVYLTPETTGELTLESAQFLPDESTCAPPVTLRNGSFTSEDHCLNYEVVWRNVLRIGLSPNPAQAQFELFIQPASGAATARILAVDRLGNSILDEVVQTPNAESLTLQIDNTKWPSGMYVIQVQSGNSSRSSCIQVVR